MDSQIHVQIVFSAPNALFKDETNLDFTVKISTCKMFSQKRSISNLNIGFFVKESNSCFAYSDQN